LLILLVAFAAWDEEALVGGVAPTAGFAREMCPAATI